MGRLLYWLPLRKQKIIRINLALCFPDHDRQALNALHLESMVYLARMALEIGAAWHWPVEKVLQHITRIEGLEHLEAGLARGRGVITVGAHLGNWATGRC